MAGFPNGEVYRVSNPAPIIFLARLYGQFAFDLGTSTMRVEDDENQLAGTACADRLVLSLGRFAVTDFFDETPTAPTGPRTPISRLAFMDARPWDYSARLPVATLRRGMELIHPEWAVRFAAVMVSTIANGDTLDTRIGNDHGLAFEYEHAVSLGSLPGESACVRL